MGGKHIEKSVDEIAICTMNKVVTTPAYMLGPTISRIALGIEKLVDEGAPSGALTYGRDKALS